MFKSPQLVRTFAKPFIVVFAPHMDDEVIGPGGTIALHRRAGATVTHVFMTDGLGSDPELISRRMPADELERRLRDLAQTRKFESRKATCGLNCLFPWHQRGTAAYQLPMVLFLDSRENKMRGGSA
jgi:LmbE family N-acetylglucosaminyl deacetylase